MPNTNSLIAFALVSLAMVCTPGPNMIYLLSRSISQGVRAGLLSLIGVAAAFGFYVLAAAAGITALLLAVPFAYDALLFAGAAYLLYLAWDAVRSGGRPPFEIRELAAHRPMRLIGMGFMTNLLNPKAAVLYLSLLPQFIKPELGDVLLQGIVLGATQIAISAAVNSLLIVVAGTVAGFLATHPTWRMLQRWLMASVLTALAVRMATEARR